MSRYDRNAFVTYAMVGKMHYIVGSRNMAVGRFFESAYVLLCSVQSYVHFSARPGENKHCFQRKIALMQHNNSADYYYRTVLDTNEQRRIVGIGIIPHI